MDGEPLMQDRAERIDHGVLPIIGALLVFLVLIGGGATWGIVSIVKALI